MPRRLALLYAGAAISGTGAGAIYATCVGNAVKWFPDRRGLAVGLTAAGFGAGAALTVIPIRMLIAARGYGDAFLWFGIGQGVIVLAGRLASCAALRSPPRPPAVTARVQQSVAQLHQRARCCARPVFWLLYVMFVLRVGERSDGDGPTRADREGLRHLPTPRCSWAHPPSASPWWSTTC